MIEEKLKKESKELEEIIKIVEKRIRNVREIRGKIRVADTEKGYQYYLVEGGRRDGNKEKTRNGKYIKKSELQLAKEIAQNDYDKKLLKNAKLRLQTIEIFLAKYEKYSIKRIFQKMHPGRRALVNNIILSDEEYVKRWSEVVYEGKQQWYDGKVILTEKGERVRSKSEKIIADKLYMLGIPYRYEYPLLLEDKVILYPDFTILKIPERKEVYLEHFGMLDDANYIESTIFKLNTYERNGIYLGVNLFVTFETGKKVLNIKAVDKMLRELFL